MEYTYYLVNNSKTNPYFIITSNEGFWVKYVTNDNRWSFSRLIRKDYGNEYKLSFFEVAYLGLDLIPLIEGQHYIEN